MAYAIKRGKSKAVARKIRHQRVRKHINGTPERPRLVVTRSNRHMVAQVVDDTIGHTLCSASTLEDVVKGIEAVVFDRGGNKYHGRVAAVAEGAREGGLRL